MSDSSAAQRLRACPSGEALLELRLALLKNASRPFPFSSAAGAAAAAAAAAPPLLAVTIPSNGTVIERYDRFGEHVVVADGVLDASLCLPADGCYGLEDYTATLLAHPRSDDEHYRFRWNGKDLKGSDRSTFPYFLRTEEDHVGKEQTMSFAEFGGGCSLNCRSDEALYEVQVWAGNSNGVGEDAYGWRIEDAVGRELVAGCGDDGVTTPSNGGGCTRPYNIRVTRACLPKHSCARFVFGNPNLSLPEGSFFSGGKGMTVVGAYNPRFVVTVDGRVVADSTRLLGDDNAAVTNANFHAVEIGGDCPQCLGDNSLLEVFAYRAASTPPYSIVLTDSTGTSATEHQAVPASSRSLQYARRCIPRAGCYRLQVSIPESAVRRNRSYHESIPAVIKVDSAYVLNEDVFFAWHGSRYAHSLTVHAGAGCTKETACAAGESLVTVHVDTSQARVDTPPGFGTFFVYNTSSPFPFDSWIMPPPVPVTSFNRGYPAGSQFQHRACVQDAAHQSFGMWNSLPSDVTWSVERDGEPLACRLASDEDMFHEAIISTPLDGSCGSSGSTAPPAGAIAGIVIGSVVVAAVLVALFWRRSLPRGRSMVSVQAVERDASRKVQESRSLLLSERAATERATNEAPTTAMVIV